MSKEAESAPQTFPAWLLLQIERDDPVGDLAYDVQQDPNFPFRVGAFITLKRYLLSAKAKDIVIRAAQQAWGEWETFKAGQE